MIGDLIGCGRHSSERNGNRFARFSSDLISTSPLTHQREIRYAILSIRAY